LTNITLPFVGGSADATEASKSTAFGYIFGDTTYTNAVETTQYYGPSSTVTYYLPASLTEVTLTGGSVFYGSFSFCTKLVSVDMPAGEYAIPESCFYGCKMLKSLGNNDAHITAIGAYAFKNCSWLEALDGCPVPVIGKEAFMNCTRLSKVRLTAENLSIGQNAFKGCTALETLSLPASLAAIDASAFADVLSIKSLTAPTSVLSFVSKTALTSAVINGGTEIPANAFKGATLLTEVTIGDSITAIGASAFSNTAVEKVYISDLSVWLQIDFANADANPIGGASLYVDGTLTESITVPTGITAIKNYAFYSAQIQSVNLHADVTSIGNGAFAGCTGLAEITLPQGLKSIGNGVFKDCTGLANIYYNAISMNDVASAADAFAGIKAALHIGSDVTRIPAYIFIGSDMTSVEFAGNACAEIGDYAFSHCTRLLDLSLPVGLRTIGDYAFSNCTRLAELSLPVGLQTISDYAFFECDSIATLELPEGLTTLGAGAFESCMELEETTLPTTLKTVGSYAIDQGYIYIKDIAAYCQINVTPDANGVVRGFGSVLLLSEGYGGSSISRLVVPKEVTSFGNIWSGNDDLVSVTFEEGSALTSIAEGAFENCSSLQSVHLPAAMNGQSVDLLIEDVFPGLTVYCEWAEADDLDGDFNLSRADFYYYSATQAQDCWHWVNGKPTLW
ncbi:MAG: leucine-rich repeat domain-containing protein, partial [Clostridia bacterium]|nr:leucine-rich repeat domain-containing protein [Clostridia bacterium]